MNKLKRSGILIYFMLFLANVCTSQEKFFCGYNDTNKPPDINESICQFFGAKSNQDAKITVDAILGKIGVTNSIKIVPCMNINNCYAWFYNNKENPAQYILYDPAFLEKLQSVSSAEWGAKCVLAHEVAHILFGHTFFQFATKPEYELAADQWSGYALYKLGAPYESILDGVNLYGDEYATHTHPPKSERRVEIEKGYNKAKQEYESNSGTAKPNLDLARAYYEDAVASGDNAEKIILFGKALQKNGNYEDAYYYRAVAYASEKDYTKALANIENAISIDPGDAYNLYKKADILHSMKNYAEALPIIKQALAKDKTKDLFYYTKGTIEYALKDYSSTINTMTTVIGINNKYEDAYYYRGVCFRLQEDYSSALNDFDQVLQIDDKDAINFLGRARTHLDLKNYRLALRDFEKAKELDNTASTDLDENIKLCKEKIEASPESSMKANMKRTWIEHNTTKNGEKGMSVFVEFSAFNMEGFRGRASCYFYYEDGTALKGVTGNITEDGKLSAGQDFNPAYNPESYYEAYELFLPYSSLQMPVGKANLKCYVNIWGYDKENKAYDLAEGEYMSFVANF